ncbi:MAG: ribosomal protein S18-alanine N-acetyltransferase [Ilumatobacter sp.]|nr:ribosomal protein S18-alanine N-acetyltransferase [Ilumatobacter sp.]
MSVLERLRGREYDKGFSIAPLRKRDLRHGVLGIEATAYPVGWSHNVFVNEIDQMRSGTRHYAVARQDGSIVGYAGVWFAVDEAHVTNVAVDPDFRRQGVARALMLHLAELAIERGCVAWTLEVRVSSHGAQQLYEEFGFESAGVRQRYYDNVEDAIVMWCHDIQGDDYRTRLNTIREVTYDSANE